MTESCNAVALSWYVTLIDELKNIVVETEFAARWTLIEGYHQLGKRILEETQNFDREKIYGQQIVQQIATSLDKSERTIYYAIKFAEQFPTPNELPEGKNVSWREVCRKYLTEPKEIEQYCLCPGCGSEVMPIMAKCRCGLEFEVKSEGIRRR